MINRNQNQRRSRAFRLEFLESRELLSSVVSLAHRSAEVIPLRKVAKETIQGALTGEGFVSPTSVTKGSVTEHASGMVTVLGQVALNASNNYSINKRNAVKYSGGTGTLSSVARRSRFPFRVPERMRAAAPSHSK